MRKIFSIIIFFLVANNSFSQVISDTTYYEGVFLNTCFLYTDSTILDCYSSSEIVTPKDRFFFIYGTTTCKSWLNNVNFYKIIFRNQMYYVNEKNVKVFGANFYFLDSLSKFDKNKLEINTDSISKIFYNNSEIKLASYHKKLELKKLLIEDFGVSDESEYTEGTGFNITVSNTTSKKIKYLYIKIEGINPVGDPVKEKGNSVINLTAVGPLTKDVSSTFNFDYTWGTDLVQDVKIISIKIQYFDNTFFLIQNPVKEIIPHDISEILNYY